MPKATTSSTKTSDPRTDRRIEILDAALRLIAKTGVDSITHRRVATAAGVPLGSTTYYFESREHLLREAFRHYISRVSETMSELSAQVKQRATIRRMVDFAVGLTEREFIDEAMLIAEFELTLFAARDPVLALELHAWQDAILADVAEAMQELNVSRPFDAARIVIQMIRGYELEQLTRHRPRSGDLRRRMQRLLESLADT